MTVPQPTPEHLVLAGIASPEHRSEELVLETRVESMDVDAGALGRLVHQHLDEEPGRTLRLDAQLALNSFDCARQRRRGFRAVRKRVTRMIEDTYEALLGIEQRSKGGGGVLEVTVRDDVAEPGAVGPDVAHDVPQEGLSERRRSAALHPVVSLEKSVATSVMDSSPKLRRENLDGLANEARLPVEAGVRAAVEILKVDGVLAEEIPLVVIIVPAAVIFLTVVFVRGGFLAPGLFAPAVLRVEERSEVGHGRVDFHLRNEHAGAGTVRLGLEEHHRHVHAHDIVARTVVAIRVLELSKIALVLAGVSVQLPKEHVLQAGTIAKLAWWMNDYVC